MIRIQGMVLLSLIFFISSPARAGLFGTIDSVDILKKIADAKGAKNDNRGIASEAGKSEDEKIPADLNKNN